MSFRQDPDVSIHLGHASELGGRDLPARWLGALHIPSCDPKSRSAFTVHSNPSTPTPETMSIERARGLAPDGIVAATDELVRTLALLGDDGTEMFNRSSRPTNVCRYLTARFRVS